MEYNDWLDYMWEHAFIRIYVKNKEKEPFLDSAGEQYWMLDGEDNSVELVVQYLVEEGLIKIPEAQKQIIIVEL